MTVFLNSRKGIECRINNIDLSKELVSFNASYASVSLPESGMALMTGSLTLVQSETTNLDFDTRFTQTWRRGSKIELTQDGSPIPICGTAYIITADYDMASTLVINFGCYLSLYNFRTTNDIGVCLEFGAEKQIGSLVSEMLIASGIPSDSLELGSFFTLNRFKIVQPYLIGASQSIIQASSKFVGQYGGCLVQRPNGQISIIYLTDDLQYVHYNKAEELQSYTRTGIPESIVKKITFNYNIEKPCSALGASSKSIRSGDTVVEVEETRDKDLRTTETILREFRDINNRLQLISTTTTRSTFEEASQSYLSVNRNGSIQPLSKCFPDDKARLLRKAVISESDNTEVVKGWLAAKEAAGTDASSFNISGTITANSTVEEYIYDDTTITKIVNVSQPRAVSIPVSGDLTLGRDGGQQIEDIDPTTLVPFERTIEIWTKPQEACRKWSYTKTVYKNRNFVVPQELEQQIKSSKPLEAIVEDSLELVPLSRETLFNQDEPSFETFQVDVEVAEESKELIVGSGVGVGGEFEIEDEIDLGNFAVFDESYFNKVCSNIMTFRNGRIMGMQVSMSPWIIKDSNNFVPLARSKVIEPDRPVGSILLLDSPSIVGSEKEVVITYVGSFVAFSNDPNNGNVFSDNLIYPLTLPSANPLQSFIGLPVNYTITSRMEYTLT